MKRIKIITGFLAAVLTINSVIFREIPAVNSSNEFQEESLAETTVMQTTSTSITSTTTSTSTAVKTSETITRLARTTTSEEVTQTQTQTQTETETESVQTEEVSTEITYPYYEEGRVEGDNSYWYSPTKYVHDYEGLPYSYVADEDNLYFDNITISKRDYILLCNCVANEYGCADYVPTYERSLVCEVLFNRLNDGWASDLYGVITAPNQFTGCYNYANAETFVGVAETPQVQNAVCMYLDNCDSDKYYNEGYYFFIGDTVWNYFRTSY